MSRKSDIVSRFTRSLSTYDAHADLQAHVSAQLASILPRFERPDVLELGCGTGLFTQELFKRYPNGRFVISDISNEAVRACEERGGRRDARSFCVIDGDSLAYDQRFDVIASSMALHWFDDPAASLHAQRAALNPGGCVVFAGIGPENFVEWSNTLDELGHSNGVVTMPELPGITTEEHIAVDYGSAHNFLRTLKDTGATIPRADHVPVGSGALRQACRHLDQRFSGIVTWHIVYGVLEAKSSDEDAPSSEKIVVAE